MKPPLWVWPAAIALVLLGIGYETPAAALLAVAHQWNVLLFILGLMGFSAAAEESGAFAWMTGRLLALAGGSRRRLFVLLFLAGAGVTLVLSNDATAVVLTPIVYRAVARRDGDAMPFLFGCTFVADTASFGLPFANPANVLVLPHPQPISYLLHLGPPQIAAIAINLGIFLLVFRSRLRGRYVVEAGPELTPEGTHTLAVLACVAVAYLVALGFEWPLGIVAGAGALAALAAGRIGLRVAARHVSWSTLGLLVGLFVVLDSAARAGLFTDALQALERMARFGYPAATVAAAAGAALASNLINNLPVAALAAYVAAHPPTASLAYALIAGVDLGPNLTVNGSLATILWIAMLRRRGVRVDAMEYLRLGALVVPPALGVTLLWLWLVR